MLLLPAETPCGGGTVEHIVPRCCGGPDEWENLALACRECNQVKAGRRLERFRDHLRTLIASCDRLLREARGG
ncbi:MAG: HNH endonuclease [Planctomycetaceae bacterium]